jgi:hypothetical protein
MKTIRLIKRHLAFAQIPSYHLQTRSIWWPFWVTRVWCIDEGKMRKTFEEYRKRPWCDITKVLEAV